MKPIVIDNCEYLTAADAAKYLGLSRARVSQLIKKGRFRAKYVGASTLVPISNIKMYRALEGTAERKPGRKVICNNEKCPRYEQGKPGNCSNYFFYSLDECPNYRKNYKELKTDDAWNRRVKLAKRFKPVRPFD